MWVKLYEEYWRDVPLDYVGWIGGVLLDYVDRMGMLVGIERQVSCLIEGRGARFSIISQQYLK